MYTRIDLSDQSLGAILLFSYRLSYVNNKPVIGSHLKLKSVSSSLESELHCQKFRWIFTYLVYHKVSILTILKINEYHVAMKDHHYTISIVLPEIVMNVKSISKLLDQLNNDIENDFLKSLKQQIIDKFRKPSLALKTLIGKTHYKKCIDAVKYSRRMCRSGKKAIEAISKFLFNTASDHSRFYL